MKSELITEVMNKLIGDIEPIGECYHDEESHKNLEIAIDVCEDLIESIYHISRLVDAREGSKAKSGELAKKFIDNIGN